jgi:hypothetical protein
LLCMSLGGAPEGGSVVLDVAQLEALLARTFSIGLDVGRGREKVALVRHDCTTVTTPAEQAAATAGLTSAAAGVERQRNDHWALRSRGKPR